MEEKFYLKQRYGSMHILFISMIILGIILFYTNRNLLFFIALEFVGVSFLIYFYLHIKVFLFYDNIFVLGQGIKIINLKTTKFAYSALKECYLHLTSVRGQDSIEFIIDDSRIKKKVVINFEGNDERYAIAAFLKQKGVDVFCDEVTSAVKIFNISADKLKWKIKPYKPFFGKWYYV